MLDFTSALYLGLRHPSWSLRPWGQLTAGRPASLAVPASQARVSEALAQLVGCERAVLGTSTLHVFWDVFGMLPEASVIYLDAGVYPVARWGIERAAARNVPIRTFRHYDDNALDDALRRGSNARSIPVVVADGFCPGCGRSAPIKRYVELVQRSGGMLILDDTQALGIFGQRPGLDAPYGRHGGGSLRFHAVSSAHVLLISSLAKAFGAPLAMFAGTDAMVRTFEARSETRMHASPPSVASLRAAERALELNASHGDALRARLAQLVCRLRRRLAEAGFRTLGGCFPVQTLRSGFDAEALHQRLLQSGIRTVLHSARHSRAARMSWLITARHTAGEIERAADTIQKLGAIPRVAS